ncbi:MAG: SRPBCC domain-containing protein [Tetrasphaera sp.]
MTATDLTETYSSVTITRPIGAAPERVWRAFGEPAEFASWFTAPGDEVAMSFGEHDLSVGGRIEQTADFHGGPLSRFVARVTDVVPGRRIAYAYDMWLDDRHMSTSVTVITLADNGSGTELTWVEQGAHVDGIDTPEQREAGTVGLIGQLAHHCAAGA